MPTSYDAERRLCFFEQPVREPPSSPEQTPQASRNAESTISPEEKRAAQKTYVEAKRLAALYPEGSSGDSFSSSLRIIEKLRTSNKPEKEQQIFREIQLMKRGVDSHKQNFEKRFNDTFVALDFTGAQDISVDKAKAMIGFLKDSMNQDGKPAQFLTKGKGTLDGVLKSTGKLKTAIEESGDIPDDAKPALVAEVKSISAEMLDYTRVLKEIEQDPEQEFLKKNGFNTTLKGQKTLQWMTMTEILNSSMWASPLTRNGTVVSATVLPDGVVEIRHEGMDKKDADKIIQTAESCIQDHVDTGRITNFPSKYVRIRLTQE